MAMSWQRPFKELNPKVEELIVKVLEEGKGAGQSPEWQTLGLPQPPLSTWRG